MSIKKTGSLLLCRRLWVYVRPFSGVLVLGIVANMAFSGLDALFTYLIKPFLDKSFIEHDLAFERWIPIILLLGITLRAIVTGAGSYCMTYVARHVIKSFRQRVFRQLIQLPAQFYDKTTTGQLLSKLLYDVEQIAQVSSDALTVFVQSSFLVIGMMVVMFVISWKLSLFFFITVPFIALIVQLSNKRIRRVSGDVQLSMGVVTEIAEETIEGYRVIRTYGGQAYETEKFDNALENNRYRDMKVAMTRALNVAGVQLVLAIGAAALISVAILMQASTEVSAGGFISMLAAMLLLIKPLKRLTTVNSTIQRGLAGVQSVFKLLDEPTEQDTGQSTVERVQGSIRYENVQFGYAAQKELVLKQFNLTIKPGETVALVGRSGSGKTTIANLLPRFYDLSAGCIYLDNQDIRTVNLKSLRAQIAIVSQDVMLFNDTIANNIAYGLVDKVTPAQIVQAAAAANAMTFIKDLPDGLETRVGENGLLLSGGQRQRLAIARALLKDAPILILDEATSALDTESERLIQDALEKIMENRTTLVIAHRLSTIEKADQIVVLDTGIVLEQGTHHALLAKKGAYAALHAMQFNSSSAELDLHELQLESA